MRQNHVLALLCFLLLGTPIVSLGQSTAAPSDQSQSQGTKLTNRDVLDLVNSGLTTEIVVAKIKSTECAFDTSPSALKELKALGIPDSVILAMVTAGNGSVKSVDSPQNLPASPPTAQVMESHAEPAPSSNPKGYRITYVKSDKKWKYGLRSEPYDKVSDYLVTKLVDNLNIKGVKTVAEIDGACCFVSVELLEVTTHPAVVKKPGIDASANLAVTNAEGKLIYSKGYRGESRTVANTWGHLINHASEDLAKNMAEDENLIHVLATGTL
jgi:hypothetical protein